MKRPGLHLEDGQSGRRATRFIASSLLSPTLHVKRWPQTHPFFWRTIHVASYLCGELRPSLTILAFSIRINRIRRIQIYAPNRPCKWKRGHSHVAHADGKRNPDRLRIRREYLDRSAHG